MDCVGCDKCRLWGKIQTSGVGTALKILFELDENALKYVFAFWGFRKGGFLTFVS